jgi:regulator of protease activity HflC (stomatin/prohibitin superfamily)
MQEASTETIILTILFWTAVLIIVLILVALAKGIKTVKEYERLMVFRLGRAAGFRGPGLVIIWPIIERFQKVDIRTKTLEVPKQEVMTTDNVPVSINAICYYKIVNPEKAIIYVRDYQNAVYQLAQATTRSVVGESQLDEVLSKRDKLNMKIKAIISSMIGDWGLEIMNMEIKDVELPDSMKRAMARQAEAERDKRGRIIQAEGEKIASEKLAQASAVFADNPEGMHLRTLQALTEIGTEKNETTILLMPVELIEAFESVPSLVRLFKGTKE